jgi:hypothetical protein
MLGSGAHKTLSRRKASMLPDFPAFTNSWTVLLIFAVMVLRLHLILVVWLKLGKLAWKIVDYIWLGFAALGLIGASGQARQLIANNMSAIAEARIQTSYELFRNLVDRYSQEGAVCRTFVRGEYSPPPEEFERRQRDYDKVCGWFREIAAKLPRNVAAGAGEIDLGKLSP